MLFGCYYGAINTNEQIHFLRPLFRQATAVTVQRAAAGWEMAGYERAHTLITSLVPNFGIYRKVFTEIPLIHSPHARFDL